MSSPSSDPPSEALLNAEGVHKRYGGVHALRGASLHVGPGEVHGLVGENGSGKSTLLKILSGQVVPDEGSAVLDGKPCVFGDPVASIAAGIATVTQETTLVPDLTVAENILLGRRLVRRWYGVDWGATRKRAREALERLELEISPRRVVSTLRPDEQQMVEIARALSMDARVLILDEPTSSLTDDEVEALFRIVRRLRGQGVSTIFVSHRMGEIFDLVDRVTILRDGNVVNAARIGDYDRDSIIEAMVGHKPESFVSADAGTGEIEKPMLRVRGLTVPGRVDDVSLDVAPGEIVGIAGLVGAGRSEVFSAIFGLEDYHGAVEVDGVPSRPRGPVQAMRDGLAYVPADRKSFGLVLEMTTRENLMMASTASRWRVTRPTRGRELPKVRQIVEDLGVVGGGNGAPVASLSGGNQQKVVLGKWLGTDPKVLIMDEPTRGVDVGAKTEIYRLLDAARERGLAVLISSSETPELLLLCDRVLVMYRGRITAAFPRAEATEARIAHYATGHQ